MSNFENAPVVRTVKAESPVWDPSSLFLGADLMDVDSPCSWETEPAYTIEAPYSHIQSPDFLPLASPFDHAHNSSVSFSSTALNSRPFIFLSRLDSPSNSNERLADPATSPLADTIMSTPADLTMSSHTFTPFTKKFELSDDWIHSGSYISPVIHSQQAKQAPLRLFSSPALSFLDRLQASSSPSSAVPPRHGARVLPPLLSPCKLITRSRASAKKENLSLAQLCAQFPADSSSPSASSPVSRRPFKVLPRISPQRPANTLFPVSPLTPLTPSPNKSTAGTTKNSVPPTKPRKRRRSMSESPAPLAKRARYNLEAPPSPVAKSEPVFSTRTFPSIDFVVSADFPLFYRRFPASSYFQTGEYESPCELFGMRHPGGEYRPPRDAFDLYSPRFTKGKGADKMGLCPICIEPLHRGGEGKKVWLSMKFSAFNYHMHFHHGISASSARPLSPPIDFRVTAREAPKKNERAKVQQGKCHKCLRWVVLETVKDVEVKVPELIWWKHAVACHFGSVVAGEGDVFEEDEVYEVLKRIAD
ncbi:hypothetical protein DFH06DRAFT_1225475 [Mycena polygramma]|nr:hypothetical protein DFH06DRAFT_1225475 [Mycena polygramma]